jgi:hypothetical protein
MNRNIIPLMGIIAIAWIMVFFGSFIIFSLIVPLPDLFMSRIGIIITAIIKVILSMILVILWLFIMRQLTKLYLKKFIR